MNSQWFKSGRTLYFGLSLLLLCLLVSGLISYFARPNTAASVSWMLSGLIGGCALALLLIWLQFRREFKPFTGLLKLGSSINNEDLSSLTFAITELSQGNMSIRYDRKAKPVPQTGVADTDALIKIMNDMVNHLDEMSDVFNALTDVPSKRLCYVGADSFREGQRCGEVMGELLGGKGQVAVATDNAKATNLELRRKGFQCVIREKYPNIQIVDVLESREDSEKAYKNVCAALSKYPHLAGIYVTEGATPSAVAKAVVEAKKARKVMIVSHDLTDATLKCLKDGTIAASLGQNPFAQGHDPVIHLFNHLVAGWMPPAPRLLTQMEVITPENYHQFWEKDKGLVQSTAESARLARVIQQSSPKPLKIAVLGREDSAFWTPVKNGVLAAAEKLRGFNVKVDWVVPEKTLKYKDFSLAVYGEAIESLVSQGYQGIATSVFDRDLIPFINRVIEQGVPIITLNSEPMSLRSLIATIIDQAKKLMGMSEQFATSTVQASAATTHINATMGVIVGGTAQQNEQIKRTEGDLESLLVNIDQVNHDAAESAASAENTAKAVGEGTTAMDQTLTSIRAIERSVEETWKIVGELGKHSERIDVVIEVIDDIASMVNVLALNASIEATRAGEAGKGFMVVANEIRKLSKRTAESTREVTELINSVQSGIIGVQKSMENGLEKVKQSTSMTDKAKVLLSGIRQLVESNRNRMTKIASAIGDMQRLSHQVGAAMESVASVSGQNVHSIDEINVATKQLNDQISYTADMAKSLETISQSQQELLAKFTVN
jgi:methyl-accepting chemotaxis protein